MAGAAAAFLVAPIKAAMTNLKRNSSACSMPTSLPPDWSGEAARPRHGGAPRDLRDPRRRRGQMASLQRGSSDGGGVISPGPNAFSVHSHTHRLACAHNCVQRGLKWRGMRRCSYRAIKCLASLGARVTGLRCSTVPERS